MSEDIIELLKAMIMAGIPIAIISFALIYLAIQRSYISAEEDFNSLKKKKKQAKKDKEDFKINPVHQKWLYFGGGYYGLMAFTTYIHVEVLEIIDFFSAYTTFSHFVDQITFAAFIGLIVDSFLNLIPAFTWFLYWPKVIAMDQGWYWLLMSYLGYQLGNYVAKWYANKNLQDADD